MLEKLKELVFAFKDMISCTSNETIARTIVLFVMVINAGCALMGWTPIELDENLIYEVVSAVGIIFASIWAWWRNNSFTKDAQAADAYCAELKSQHKEE